MSPISVAQFLEPGLHEFDLLVIDEASQVRPEDALGAIARARQIVVVGDQKQLPPTSFFDRLLGDGDEDEADEDEDGEDLLGGAAKLGQLESVLSLCEARGLGSRMLEWHYRSRDPSLIKVSNREFYKNGLILPPSPLQDDPAYGLCFSKVDGAYDRGGKRDNRKEGEAIVARIREHAQKTPKLSLGVVTFSSAQRNLITELLELARRQDSALDELLREGKSEDFFVKNIENVQGDERDVILVSVGYGPTSPGGPLTSMSFGPVNSEGGERRLNVLFTRARLRCEVFASFDPSAMDITRVTREGPKVLKRFLEFAQSGLISDAEITGEEADSLFEEDVADAVRALGFTADHQVGSAGFRIDLGIRDPARPGTYILAIECDGATYHSALWARERDRLRQGVLEHLGWRFHRIWSTDWFYNRAAELQRLKSVLETARASSMNGIEVPGSNTFSPQIRPEPLAVPIDIPEIVVRQMPPYMRANLTASRTHEPHEVPANVLTGLVARIVEAEGPIHQEEVSRRVADAFGKERAGSRIYALTLKALRTARQYSDTLRDGDEFWYTLEQQNTPPVRNRSAEQGPTLKADNISLLEIGAALSIAHEDNAGGSEDDLIRTAAQLLGFRRVGPDLRARLQQGLTGA
jgi:very-short-patch-repair endonuclease